MKCQRCHGMMIREAVFTKQGEAAVLKCVQCGSVIDPVAVANEKRRRLRSKKKAPPAQKAPLRFAG